MQIVFVAALAAFAFLALLVVGVVGALVVAAILRRRRARPGPGAELAVAAERRQRLAERELAEIRRLLDEMYGKAVGAAPEAPRPNP
jgi:hypothetical protein